MPHTGRVHDEQSNGKIDLSDLSTRSPNLWPSGRPRDGRGRGDQADRSPLTVGARGATSRSKLPTMLEDKAHRPLTHLHRKPLAVLAHQPILPRTKASNIPGANHCRRSGPRQPGADFVAPARRLNLGNATKIIAPSRAAPRIATTTIADVGQPLDLTEWVALLLRAAVFVPLCVGPLAVPGGFDAVGAECDFVEAGCFVALLVWGLMGLTRLDDDVARCFVVVNFGAAVAWVGCFVVIDCGAFVAGRRVADDDDVARASALASAATAIKLSTEHAVSTASSTTVLATFG